MTEFSVATVVPGKTILTYDVGYNMSLPKFCIVEGMTKSKKSLRVRMMTDILEKDISDGHKFVGYKVPGEPYGELITVRVSKYGPKMGNHLMFVWNGEGQYYNCLD